MRVLSKDDVNKKLLAEIADGAVFIYPTDTIYGIGCDATNDSAVRRIRELKQRDTKPFSIVAPSIEWIKDNCVISEKAKAWLLKLPGPYTLIAELKNPVVCAQVNMGLKTIGVRLPAHWISNVVASYGRPIVTTSVNVSGKPFATNLEELKSFEVDFILYDGDRAGKPSVVVDLSTGEFKRQ